MVLLNQLWKDKYSLSGYLRPLQFAPSNDHAMIMSLTDEMNSGIQLLWIENMFKETTDKCHVWSPVSGPYGHVHPQQSICSYLLFCSLKCFLYFLKGLEKQLIYWRKLVKSVKTNILKDLMKLLFLALLICISPACQSPYLKVPSIREVTVG